MSGYRLATGGVIDRARTVSFRWGGRTLTGHPGDTLASALLANGVDIVGRSFKYHRPRGLLAAGLDEPNAIVQLETGAASVPNVKASQIELYEGLRAKAVNAWPSPGFDLLAVNSLIKRFIPAAFYYKTFFWPNWHLFEPSIRKAAGLGTAPVGSDPDRYEHRWAQADVIVVGAGLAGLGAAIEAGRTGKRVLLVEHEAVCGGRLAGADDPRVAAALAEIGRLSNVTLLTRTVAIGAYDHGMVALAERVTDHLPLDARQGPRQRLWKVRTGSLILATGVIERPLVFANNDLPGVMLASAAVTYARRFGAAPGRRVVVATNNDAGHEAAVALAALGVTVVAVGDARADVAAARQAATEAAGITVHTATAPLRATGRRAVTGVLLAALHEDGTAGPVRETIACDALLMSGGFSPVVHLHSQAGGSLRFDEAIQAFVPTAGADWVRSVGAAAGDFAGGTIRPLWSIAADAAEPSAYAWVDFQNDVTAGDVALAARENFRSVEHLKRYTTLGMASDQGKTSNVNGIGIMAGLLGVAPEAVGTTRFRPPYDPTTIGAFAGPRIGAGYRLRRRIPGAALHSAQGAVFEDYGAWERPAYYARPGEDEHAAIAREAAAVRGGCGLFDASTLGKIEVTGPDAAAFIDFLYVQPMRGLKPGRCRYGVMLDENGVVFDDGVVARMGEERYLVNTSSGHAGAVAAAMQEWLQCEFPHHAVLTRNVTNQWAVVSVAGPRSRAVIASLGGDVDLSPEALPHLGFASGTIGGMPCRIQRVSFTGEMAYEIAVPWTMGEALWRRLSAIEGVTPFGVETLMALRLEKGFLHLGSDTDGTTLPQDIDLGDIAARKKGDFVGRRSTTRPDGARPGRRQLVGLTVTDGGGPLAAGAHVLPAGMTDPKGTDGWVTSSAQSVALGRPVAMALVADGVARMGQPVRVWDMGDWREARISERCPLDPAGERMRG